MQCVIHLLENWLNPIASKLMVPTLRVVTQSMTLCVIRDVAHAVRLCGPQKKD